MWPAVGIVYKLSGRRVEVTGKGIPVPVSINNEENNLWLTFSFLEIVNVRKWVVLFFPSLYFSTS